MDWFSFLLLTLLQITSKNDQHESSPQEFYMHRLFLSGLGIFGTLIYTLGPVFFMLFLSSVGLRAFALCTLTFVSPFGALVCVWSCRVPVPDSDLSELPFVMGQHILGWTWSAALWSVATVVLGGSPGAQLFWIPATWLKLLSNDDLVTV